MTNSTYLHPQDRIDISWFETHPRHGYFYRRLNPEVDARWIGREGWTHALVICVNHETNRNQYLVVPIARDEQMEQELRDGVPLMDAIILANGETR